MKLQVLSDLHLESQAFTLKVHPEADAIVLAGDIAAPSAFKRMAALIAGAAKKVPVLYIPGNHEYYRSSISFASVALRDMFSDIPNAFDLTQRNHRMGDVMFVGATLWSDFDLPFLVGNKLVSDRAQAMRIAGQGVCDFTAIDRWTPWDAAETHRQDRRYIELMLKAQPPEQKTVVVTHFLPSEKSIDHRFRNSPLNPYFASDLDALMGPQVKLWIHGHTHASCDYVLKGTRVVCNPRGYTEKENPAFRSQLLIEV